jgi:tryptophan 2,3-dioxygenase
VSGKPPLTDYERYIRTEELLALQKPEAQLSCHDELQFQIVHQVSELWMKLVLHEVDEAIRRMDDDRATAAAHTLRRIHEIQRLLVDQLRLLETMAPKDYMTIRAALARGSGQESPGFKAMCRAPLKLWPSFQALLEKRGRNLREIHENPDQEAELFGLAESLIDYDESLQLWRHHHLLLVYRIIGEGTPSLKGKHSELLVEGMKERFFPELWKVREDVFEEWTLAMKASGQDKGYH